MLLNSKSTSSHKMKRKLLPYSSASFATSEMELDYYQLRLNIQVSSRGTKRCNSQDFKTLGKF